MADAATTQVIYESSQALVAKYTNVSDGTGEAAVLKVDVSALTPGCEEVTVEKIIYSTSGMSVDIYWDATTDVLLWTLPSDHAGEAEFKGITGYFGIKNNSGAGKTGDIMFTTRGHTAGDTYCVYLVMRKMQT